MNSAFQEWPSAASVSSSDLSLKKTKLESIDPSFSRVADDDGHLFNDAAAAAAVAAVAAAGRPSPTDESMFSLTPAGKRLRLSDADTAEVLATANYDHLMARAGGTNPKRAQQNREAQRKFRLRKERYIKELELQVADLKNVHGQMEELRKQNQELRDYVFMLHSKMVDGESVPDLPDWFVKGLK